MGCPDRRTCQGSPALPGAWQTAIVIREPAELQIDDDGRVSLPLGLLAEAGLDAGGRILAFSDGDGRIVLQREVDAFKALLQDGTL